MKQVALVFAGLSIAFFIVMTVLLALNNFETRFIILVAVGFVISCGSTIWYLYAPETLNSRVTSTERPKPTPSTSNKTTTTTSPRPDAKENIQKRLNLLKELWESKAIDDAEYEKKRNDILSDI